MEQYINDVFKFVLLPTLMFLLREVYRFNKTIGVFETSIQTIHKRIDKLEAKLERKVEGFKDEK